MVQCGDFTLDTGPLGGCNRCNKLEVCVHFSITTLLLSLQLEILQLRSNHMHLHYQLIKAGSNQKERRYNIRFVMCDPIRIAAVVCSLLGCHGRLVEEDLVVHSTKNCEESAAQLIS